MAKTPPGTRAGACGPDGGRQSDPLTNPVLRATCLRATCRLSRATCSRAVTPGERHPGANRVAWINDDLIAFRETAQHFRFEAAALPDCHHLELSGVVDHLVDRPLGPLSEEAARRHLEHVILRPDDDARLDSIAVAEPLADLAGLFEIDQDVHPLFLDAERGDFRESRRLYPADPAAERLVPAPLVDQHRLPRLYIDGGAGQKVCDDLQTPEVADLDQRLASRDDAGAFLKQAEHDAAHGRVERNRGDAALAGLPQARARDLELVAGGAHVEIRRLDRPLERRHTALDVLQLSDGNRPGRQQLAGTFQLRLRKLQLALEALALGSRGANRGFRRARTRLELGARPHVEKRRIRGRESGDHGLARDDGVSRLELDALHASGDRRRHDVAIADSRTPFVLYRDLEDALLRRGEVGLHGRR